LRSKRVQEKFPVWSSAVDVQCACNGLCILLYKLCFLVCENYHDRKIKVQYFALIFIQYGTIIYVTTEQ
jgi:hypothetical protein